MLRKREPVYQALWAGPCDFDEVLISPVMIQDHMPDNMLKALNKVSKQAVSHLQGEKKVETGIYSPLEESRDNVVITRNNINEESVVPTELDNVSSNASDDTALIVVDVEVHQRNEMQPGS